MLFNTFGFLIFFVIVTIIYFLIPKKVRYIWLLGASYFFYMNWSVKYSLLLVISTAVTYICGFLIDKYRSNTRAAKTFLALSFIINLAMLIVFKYTAFILENINKFTASIGNPTSFVWNVALPVGISFFIFQALSYTVDVYRKDIDAEKNFLYYALFVSFFPQLVAGPIERSKNLLTQIRNIPATSRPSYYRATRGMMLMLWGFFMKMVIADRAAIAVNAIFDNYTACTSAQLILGAILFAVQIYCDFGGYSTIAIGCAYILGFDLMDNFKQPYLAISIKDFWRRWHISLSQWFRDYLYIPLGGGRKHKYLNIMITMGVSGFWHGANWTYVFWGLLHGVYQVVESLLTTLFGLRKKEKRFVLPLFVKGIITFVLVDLAWIFFRASTLTQAFDYIKRIFTTEFIGNAFVIEGFDAIEAVVLAASVAVLIIVDCLLNKRSERVDALLTRARIVPRWCFLIGIMFVLIIFGIYGPAFSGSQFIYFQF